MSADATARQLMATTAALLDQGRRVDRLSRPLTAAALIGLLLWPAFAARPSAATVAVLALVALCGLAQTFLAVRVGFDAALFRDLAHEAGSPGLRDLDASLQQLGLMPAAKAGRPLAARAAGARRLLDRQCIALLAQAALAILGALLALLRGAP